MVFCRLPLKGYAILLTIIITANTEVKCSFFQIERAIKGSGKGSTSFKYGFDFLVLLSNLPYVF